MNKKTIQLFINEFIFYIYLNIFSKISSEMYKITLLQYDTELHG